MGHHMGIVMRYEALGVGARKEVATCDLLVLCVGLDHFASTISRHNGAKVEAPVSRELFAHAMY